MVRGSTIDITKRNSSQLELNVYIHNRFNIEVVDSASGNVKQKAEAYNLIKDRFWGVLCSSNDYKTWFNYIAFGEGTGTPTPDGIGLFQAIAYKQVNNSNRSTKSVPEEGYACCTKSVQLSPSEYVGYTITEVGVASESNSNSVLTHAMLQDMNGNPVSITKTDTDIINIYATIYVHWNPNGYDDGHIKICYMPPRVHGAGVIPELLGDLTASDSRSNTAVLYEGAVNIPYGLKSNNGNPGVSMVLRKDANAKTYTYTANRVQVDEYNYPTGIKNITFGGSLYMYPGTGGYAYYPVGGIMITAPSSGLPGRQVLGESVGTGDGVTVDFTTKFPFPNDARVYVDGVLSADVTIDSDSPGTTESVGCFFEFLPEHSTDFSGYQFGMITPDQNTTYTMASSGYATFYNKLYSFGIKNFEWESQYASSMTSLQCSDDLVNWFDVPYTVQQYRIISIPVEYANMKYWRMQNDSISSMHYKFHKVTINPVIDYSKNIHFATPPAEGSVITIDYYTTVLAKDVNHVFDLTVVMHLGEYTE